MVIVEIRHIDAWQDPDGCWYWNDSMILDTVAFKADVLWEDQFRNWLENHGVPLEGRYITTAEDETIELRDSATDRPIVAAIISLY